ncbi:hypothetical protein [Pseudomonas yamanorum]|uniref:hypothetical protein n=1 Tax=Pseudomonas yamanorum TaxID=515393 RepID=UPI003BA0CD56
MTTKKTPKKTDALTLRLDPRTKFLIELLSRAGHQTITGVIESAVSRLGFDRKVPFGEDEISLTGASVRIWSPVESERVVNLALFAPSLLNHEEGCIRAVLEGASDLFFTTYQVRDRREFDYRAHDFRHMHGAFQQSEDGKTVFITPKRRVIKLAWDLIRQRAAELAEKGVCADLSIAEVEAFIGKPIAAVAPDIKDPKVVIYDDEGISFRGAEKESDDLNESLGIKR